jgi:DNA (cytosine-5)-methyltransferase 1
MTHGSLFSGIGGFDLAATWCGWKNIFEVEIEKWAVRILAKRFSKVKIYDDIRIFDGNEYNNKIDVLSAGFPCQDASIAGKREGLNGKQTGLFTELARVIREIKPRWFVLENVPGLLSVNRGRDMARIVAQLSEIGYGVAWRVLDAQYSGVAQRRRRLFIVGSLGNMRAAEILLVTEGNRRDIASVDQIREVGLCISARDGEKQDPSAETIIAQTTTESDYRRTPISQFGNEANPLAYTITASGRGAPRHHTEETLIASINGIGERKTDGISRGLDRHRSRGLGNAVVPRVVYEIFKRINEFGTF